jgi:hypothetical protein
MDLTRVDPSQNLHRFYRMEIAPGLFGDWSLVRAGPGRLVRHGGCGKKCPVRHPNEEGAARLRVGGVRTGRFVPAVLVALICALLNLSFIHSGADVWRSMILLQCLERRDCFTSLVWIPELRYMNK